jgi:hypothetical protein
MSKYCEFSLHGLFNDTFNIYATQHQMVGQYMKDGELERIWKKAAMVNHGTIPEFA